LCLLISQNTTLGWLPPGAKGKVEKERKENNKVGRRMEKRLLFFHPARRSLMAEKDDAFILQCT
jgi:hypothetical protein